MSQCPLALSDHTLNSSSFGQFPKMLLTSATVFPLIYARVNKSAKSRKSLWCICSRWQLSTYAGQPTFFLFIFLNTTLSDPSPTHESVFEAGWKDGDLVSALLSREEPRPIISVWTLIICHPINYAAPTFVLNLLGFSQPALPVSSLYTYAWLQIFMPLVLLPSAPLPQVFFLFFLLSFVCVRACVQKACASW